MFLPGLFAFRSIHAGGASMEIPNMRDPEVREKYRNDVSCCDANVASGKDLLPTTSKGTPDIPDEVYDRMRHMWENVLEQKKKNLQ